MKKKKPTKPPWSERSDYREGKLQASFCEFLCAFPQPPGSSPPVLAGQVTSLPPHLSLWGAPGFPKRRPGGGNGNTPPGSFPSQTPKTRSPGGRKFRLGPRPPPPRFSLRLAASHALMPQSRPHFWVAVQRRWRPAPGLWAGKWGRVSELVWGEAPQRSASGRHPARGAGGGGASARPALGWPRRGCRFLLPSSPGLRAELRARSPGGGEWGRKPRDGTGEPLYPSEKKVGALGGKRDTSPPSFAGSFPRAFCWCARGCAAGVAAVPVRLAPCPAPPPSTPGSSSASPRGAKWLPSQPHWAGAAAPPPAAAAPGARGLGAGDRRWKRTL